MAKKITIGGHSRWFRLATLLAMLFVLFAAILAVGAVGEGVQTGSGAGTGDGGDVEDNPGNESAEDQNETDEGAGEGDSANDGGSGGEKEGEGEGGNENKGGESDGGTTEDGDDSDDTDSDGEGEGSTAEEESGSETDGSDSENEDTTDSEDDGEDSEDEKTEQESDETVEETDRENEETVLLPPYDITVTPDPVPGRTVTVLVEKDGVAVPGAEVSFNDAVIGTTDGTGSVEGTVPYADELVISAGPPPAVTATSASLDFGGFAGAPSGIDGSLSAGVSTVDDSSNSSVTYSIPTEIAVDAHDAVVPGQTISATATLNGTGLPGVDVIVDDTVQDTTNETGQFSLEIPPDATPGEQLPIRFERGEFVGQGTIAIAEIEIEISTGLIALPGQSAEITVHAVDGDGEIPLSGIPVTIDDGEQQLVTGEDGTATATVPWSNDMTATATVGSATVSATESGFLYYLLAVLGIPALLVLGAGVWARRNPETVRYLRRRAVELLVTVGRWLRTIGQQLYARLARIPQWLRGIVQQLRQGAVLSLLFAPFRWAGVRIYAAAAWLYLAVMGVFGSGGAGSDHSPAEKPQGETAADTAKQVPAYRRLRQCWLWLVRHVVGRARNRTAVEVEQEAVEDGFPAGPVRRLRRAYQDVEYGFTSPEERVETAETAVEQLRPSDEEGDETVPATGETE